MTRKDLIQASIATILGCLSPELYSNLFTKIPDPAWRLAVLGIALGLGYISLSYLLLIFPMRFHRIRCLFDPRAYLEGLWIQIIDKNCHRYYSIFELSYQIGSGIYAIEGSAWDSNGIHHASWNSPKIDIDPASRVAQYNYTSTMADGTNEIKRGTCDLKFNRALGFNSAVWGHGIFSDRGALPATCTFDMEQLTPERLKTFGLIPDSSPLMKNSYFIMAYHDAMGPYHTLEQMRAREAAERTGLRR